MSKNTYIPLNLVFDTDGTGNIGASGANRPNNLYLANNIIMGGAITSGLWEGTAIAPLYGGTGIDTSSSTGVPTLSSGTWSISAGAPAGTLTGITLKSTVTASSLTSLGAQAQALNMGSNQINAVANPTSAQDVATKYYVDQSIAGLTWKGPVNAYASSNIALSGSSTLTIDSYSVQNGNYVILGNQTTASQNGVYVVSGIGSSYALTLLTNSEETTALGDAYLVLSGTVYGNTAFQANQISPNVTYIQFAGPTIYSFSSPLLLTGSTVTLPLTSTYLFVGNGSGNATGVAMSGDISITNSGATTIQSIRGTTVSGTTGGGNVVMSSGPTISTSGVAIGYFNSSNANGGYLEFQTGGTHIARFGTDAEWNSGSSTDFTIGAYNNLFLTTNQSTNVMGITSAGKVNIPGLSASQAVITDSSKNLTSLAYTNANTASTLVERDSSGNFSAGIITVNAIVSSSANPSTMGTLRLPSAFSIGWRNNANTGNILLATDSSDNLSYAGNSFLSSSGIVTGSSGTTGLARFAASGTLTSSIANNANFTPTIMGANGCALTIVQNANNGNSALVFAYYSNSVTIITQSGTEFTTSNTSGHTGLTLTSSTGVLTVNNQTGGSVQYLVTVLSNN